MKTKLLFLALTAKAALMFSAVAIVFWISLAIIYSGPASAAVKPKPDLIMLQVEPNASTVNAGATLSVADTVKNQGPADAKKFKVLYGLSADTTYGDKGDIKIGGGLSQRAGLVGVAAGASDASSSFNIEIPEKTPPGTYHVCATVSSSPGESDKTNNTLCSTGTVTVPPPDLVISALSTLTTAAKVGSVIQVSLSVKNQGGSQVNASKAELHASTSSTYVDPDDQSPSTKPGISKLQPGQIKTFAKQGVKVPSTPGNYFICAKSDADGVVTEGDENNNTLCTSTQITVTTTGAAATNEWLLFAGDGSGANNNLNIFKATEAPSILTPIPAVPVSPISFGSLALGEVHFANGKTFVVITSNLHALGDGGISVFDTEAQSYETSVSLVSTLKRADGVTHAAARIVHCYVDPEGKYLWANNDGPSGDTAGDSVFRINVDPSDTNPVTGYLTYVEIPVGNGHKKSAFSRPNAAHPNAKKLFFTSDLTERRVNAIDDDSTSGTYGQVIKVVRNVGASPHGMDYSPAGARAFAGLTGGGLVSIDATQLDLDSNGTIDMPDVDCNGISDNYCVATGTATPDPSVYKLASGPSDNPGLFAGYVHVHEASGTVYTTGYSGSATKGWITAINPGSGTTPPSPIKGIDLGDWSASNFAGQTKFYVPSSGNGAIHDQVDVVDPNPASPTYNTILTTVAVGTATGENRNLKVSPDERLVMVPNTSTNTASVIDTVTDTVIDTVTLASTAKNMGIVHLPANDPENNH